MLDKRVPYFDIIMKATKNSACFHPIMKLPEGYRYKMYEDGDELHWAELETSVQEFEDVVAALTRFEKSFAPFRSILPKRMCFILDDKDAYVATATAWFRTDEDPTEALLHWVSTSPKHQGLGLGKAIVIYALQKFQNLETDDTGVYLHTQTWSYPAVGLYAKLGFDITNDYLNGRTTNLEALPILKKYLRPEIYEIAVKAINQ